MTAVVDDEKFTPENIRFHKFRVVRKGFDPDEVAAYLGDVSEHVVDLNEDVAEAQQRELATRAVADRLYKENEALRGLQVVENSGPDPQAAQIVGRAQHQADQIVARAEEHARQLVADARRRAQGIHQQAEAHLQAAGVAETSDRALKLLGWTEGGLAGQLTERAQMLIEAEQRVGDAKARLLVEATQVTAAAQQVIVQLSASDDEDDEDLPPAAHDDTQPIPLEP